MEWIILGAIIIALCCGKKQPPLPINGGYPSGVKLSEIRRLENKVTEVVRAIKKNAPNFDYLYFHRSMPAESAFKTQLRHLPNPDNPSYYIPGRHIIVVSPNSQIYCYDLGSYEISDKCRGYFAGRLMQEFYGYAVIMREDVSGASFPWYVGVVADIDDLAGHDETTFCLVFSESGWKREHPQKNRTSKMGQRFYCPFFWLLWRSIAQSSALCSIKRTIGML